MRSKALAAVSLLAALAFAQHTDWASKVRATKTGEELARVANSLPKEIAEDLNVAEEIEIALSSDSDVPLNRENLANQIELRERLSARKSPNDKAGQTAKDILSSPRYKDPGIAENRSLATNAGDRLTAWLRELLGRFRPTAAAGVPGFAFPGLAPLIWGLVAVGFGLLVFLFVRAFRWQWQRKVRGGGVLDEDEPDRSSDEWLLRAGQLEAEGRYRDAVRCLYLACLMRIDEAGIARFIRTETNREHLRRIHDSALKPESIDFLPPTRHFEEVWYGNMLEGQPDLDRMREFYVFLKDATKEVAPR
ncbi:MAG: hypothetical protein KIT11_01045 [Fimbriimonadaceae bacterium]|nr:hypothetical protein [Fimbriimonadaceae bacterium]QYK55040.1 MAG: hypothetical protein KF733_08490 [Fimbriimonadaceae bacterium]